MYTVGLGAGIPHLSSLFHGFAELKRQHGLQHQL